MATSKNSQIFQTLVVALVIGAAVFFAYYISDAQWAWLVNVGLLALLCVVLGIWIMKLPEGILISNRNLMSLSRLQVVCWSLIIFSGYIVVVMQRLHHLPTQDPLAITIDPKLWAVLGISFASFVGTPLILNTKTLDTPSAKSIQSASLVLKEPSSEIKQNAEGKLYSNPSPEDARFSDIFQGDEIGNTAYVDLSKVQMFILTALLMAAYCSDMWHMLDKTQLGTEFQNLNHLPPLTANMLQLLALSHAGYLSFKAVSHTDTAT
jgi:hypothetical protein